MLRPPEDLAHYNRIAHRARRAKHPHDLVERQFRRRAFRWNQRRWAAGRFQPTKLMVEDLVQVGRHLLIGRIDFLAQVPRMLRDLLGAAEIFAHPASYAICLVSQLRVDHFGRQRRWRRFLTGWYKSRRRFLARRLLWRRRPLLLRRRPLLALGLGLGLSPHLGHAAEEIFYFVFHEEFQEPRNQIPRDEFPLFFGSWAFDLGSFFVTSSSAAWPRRTQSPVAYSCRPARCGACSSPGCPAVRCGTNRPLLWAPRP